MDATNQTALLRTILTVTTAWKAIETGNIYNLIFLLILHTGQKGF